MLIHEDAYNVRKYQSSTSVDLCIWDSPYGIGGSPFESVSKQWSKTNESWDTFGSTEEQEQAYHEMLSLLLPLLKSTGSIVAFGTRHNIYIIGYLLQVEFKCRITNHITWFKRDAVPNFSCSSLTESCEHMIVATPYEKPYFNYLKSKECQSDGVQMRDMWSISKQQNMLGRRKKLHVHQKPWMLIQRLISIYCPPGGFVLDPMCGSGIVEAVCINGGYRSLFIEKNERYFKDAKRFIKNLQTADLFFLPGTTS